MPAVDGRGTQGGAPSPPRMSGDAPGTAAKADIDNLGARMDARFAEFGARMLKVAVSIVLAQTALTVGPTVGLLELFGSTP